MNGPFIETLQVTDVHKVYKASLLKDGTIALTGASLTLNEGECCGLVGPNGAGKSTLIKIIVGIEGKNSGHVNVTKDIGTIGYVPERPAFYESLSAFDNLLYFSKLIGCPDPCARADDLLKDFGLISRKDDEVSGYSKGMRQRLAIARSLLSSPGLLILDEPFSGLDPSMTIDLKERLISMKGKGITMLISSHNLAEVQAICDNVAFMKDGSIVMKASTQQRAETSVVRFRISNDYEPSPQIASKVVFSNPGKYYDLKIARSEVPDTVASLVADGAKIEGVELAENDIETLYRSIFKEEEHA